MLAAVIDSPSDSPRLAQFAEPVLAQGRELVTLVAAGIHPVVRSLASGAHYGSGEGWPRVPGVDCVARDRRGRLCYTGFTEPPFGTIAETMSVPMTMPLPDGADPVQVAAALNPGLASWLPLRRADLTTVWVVGATGVAGALAVRNARELGAGRVVAVARRAAALARSDADATVVLGGDPEADARAFADEAARARPTLVLDFLWGAAAEAAFVGLGRSGLAQDASRTAYVEIGQSAGADATLPASLLRSTAITLSGSGAGSSPVAEILAELPAYIERIADGRVTVPVRTFRLSQVAAAWQLDEPGVRAVVVP